MLHYSDKLGIMFVLITFNDSWTALKASLSWMWGIIYPVYVSSPTPSTVYVYFPSGVSNEVRSELLAVLSAQTLICSCPMPCWHNGFLPVLGSFSLSRLSAITEVVRRLSPVTVASESHAIALHQLSDGG